MDKVINVKMVPSPDLTRISIVLTCDLPMNLAEIEWALKEYVSEAKAHTEDQDQG